MKLMKFPNFKDMNGEKLCKQKNKFYHIKGNLEGKKEKEHNQ